MNLVDYLTTEKTTKEIDEKRTNWFDKLKLRVEQGLEAFGNASNDKQKAIQEEFKNRIRTEELKAWYSTPEGEMLFQGTSVSSLTIPAEFSEPINFDNIYTLENSIADSYIKLHEKNKQKVKDAIVDDIQDWLDSGLYYSVVIASKVISQAFNLSIPYEDVVFNVENCIIDPHEILTYSNNVRKIYFNMVREKLRCFEGLNISQEDMESSLILADISKPKLEKYRKHLLLAPVRCNEIARQLAINIKKLIIEKSRGAIKPRSIQVTIFDTDTPYTYYHLIGANNSELAPPLPGLTLLGASGTIDAFRWLYVYRLSLISQKMMKSSLYSEVHRQFIPFVFFGVLVPRDADILLEMDNLAELRYRGNISPQIEFCYLIPIIEKYLKNEDRKSIIEDLKDRMF